jgi:hypothetical protein
MDFICTEKQHYINLLLVLTTWMVVLLYYFELQCVVDFRVQTFVIFENICRNTSHSFDAFSDSASAEDEI